MSIVNSTQASSFLNSYPESSYIDNTTNNWKAGTSIYDDWLSALAYFNGLGFDLDKANANAMAYVIGKYNMGIGLSKTSGSGGDFQGVFVKESNLVLNPFIETSDCNL